VEAGVRRSLIHLASNHIRLQRPTAEETKASIASVAAQPDPVLLPDAEPVEFYRQGEFQMNVWKLATGVALALSLNGASAWAEVSAQSPGRSEIHRSPSRAAPAPTHPIRESNTHKAPAIKRGSPRNRTTDLELPQLG
jgi:hypothetical protein